MVSAAEDFTKRLKDELGIVLKEPAQDKEAEEIGTGNVKKNSARHSFGLSLRVDGPSNRGLRLLEREKIIPESLVADVIPESDDEESSPPASATRTSFFPKL